MISRLRTYLELERLVLSLEGADPISADAIRDAMDPIWYRLSDDERLTLDERSIDLVSSLEGLRLPISPELTYATERRDTNQRLPRTPIQNWAA
jgi:hypothetical protein